MDSSLGTKNVTVLFYDMKSLHSTDFMCAHLQLPVTNDSRLPLPVGFRDDKLIAALFDGHHKLVKHPHELQSNNGVLLATAIYSDGHNASLELIAEQLTITSSNGSSAVIQPGFTDGKIVLGYLQGHCTLVNCLGERAELQKTPPPVSKIA